ncbi:MAG: hypothetical protein IT440_05410 [Phycisphaeraceae bacterium]|nr:hypothetical protein [Phycisphaeraceae bacterium]
MTTPRHRQPVKLGLCPIGKFVFSHEDAKRQKALLEAKLRELDIPFVNIDSVLPDGIVRDQAHVELVVRYLRQQEIEALFIPHCNFGTEGAAGMIAKHCGVPTLLWGPRDEAPLPDGSRLRDSLCGTLATSKVLHTLRVPFSYIVNSTVDDAVFVSGIQRFVRAARVARTLRTMRIGMIGQRIDFFWSTIVSEADLLQRFGVQVLPIDLPILLTTLHKRRDANRKAYQQEMAELEKWIDTRVHKDRDALLLTLALRDELVSLAAQHNLDGFVVQTFNSFQQIEGLSMSLGVSLANDLGIPVGPEGDVHGAVTSILLEAASGTPEPSFLPDITIRHPGNDNAVLLWHFEAPLSLRTPGSKVSCGLPWILKGLPPSLMHFKLKDGPVTLARFDGDSGGFRLGFGEGKMVDGPYNQEYYGWLEVDHWPTWEEQIVRGPYIHHCSCVFDSCADVLTEATRFIPGLTAERFGRSKP